MTTERTVPRVKVCGHTRYADVKASIRAGVDAIGVITDVPVETPREVSTTQATRLLEAVPPFVTGVCVTMPETVTAAVETADRTNPDALQVHSGLSPTELSTLRDRIACPLIGTVGAGSRQQVPAVADVVDLVLIDSTDATGAGGTGETHDWAQTRDIVADTETPVLLAGGLTPDNVGTAVDTVQPFGVDTASGVESSGGIKDHLAVRQFVTAATGGEAT